MQKGDLKEALESAELVEIRYTKLVAEAYDEDDEDFIKEANDQAQVQLENPDSADADEAAIEDPRAPNQHQRWELLLSGDDGMFEVGVCLTARTARSTTIVEAIAHYHLDFDLDNLMDDEVRKAAFSFAGNSALVNIIPYIREAADDLTRRIRTRPPVIDYDVSKMLNKMRKATPKFV